MGSKLQHPLTNGASASARIQYKMPKNHIPNTFGSELFPLEEITHFSRIPLPKNNGVDNIRRVSSEDYSSEPLSLGASASTGHRNKNYHRGNNHDSTKDIYHDSYPSSSEDEFDADEVLQYHRHDVRKSKSGKHKHKPGIPEPEAQAQAQARASTSNNFKNDTNDNRRNRPSSAISDDNFPSILNSNAIVTKFDLTFSIITFLMSVANFVGDGTLVVWHYSDGYSWYSAMTAIIMTVGACSILHQFSIIDMERLKRIFDHARRARILTNCFPTCGTIISSYYLTVTAWKAKTNQMFALQYFSHEEFLQNLLRVQSFFQAAPQAILQLLIFMETLRTMSYEKGIFSLINILTSLTIMTIGNIPSRSEEFDSAISPGAYSPTTRLFIGLRMFSCFGSRIMSIVYLLIGLNCLLGKFSSLSTLESFLISLSIILIPRLCFTFADYFYRSFSSQARSKSVSRGLSASCCRIFLGYLASIFFPMSDPLWIFWYIWFETITFLLFGNIVGWSNTTNCLSNLDNTIYTGIFIVVFIVIPIFLPFARATIKKRQMRRLENIFERGTVGTNSNTNTSSTTTTNSEGPKSSKTMDDNVVVLKV